MGYEVIMARLRELAEPEAVLKPMRVDWRCTVCNQPSKFGVCQLCETEGLG